MHSFITSLSYFSCFHHYFRGQLCIPSKIIPYSKKWKFVIPLCKLPTNTKIQ